MAKSNKVKQARMAKNTNNSKKRERVQAENLRVLNVLKQNRSASESK
jgi:hypothetical protein